MIHQPLSYRLSNNRFEHELYGGGVMGGIVSESFENKGVKTSDVELTTVSLNTLLKSFNAPSLIQYLSLDLEGAEYEVMKTLNFEKYTFLVITVERPSEDLHKLLGSKGYWALVQFPLVPKQVKFLLIQQNAILIFLLLNIQQSFTSVICKYLVITANGSLR
jgi:hypothetical protein